MVSAVGTFFIVLLVLALLSFTAYTVFAHLRARRLGLPPPPILPFLAGTSRSTSYPSPRPSGPIAWLTDKFRALRNRRARTTVGGAYEESLPVGGRGGRGGRAALDPDEAWDARVGTEADGYGAGGYYAEETELGLHAPTAYHAGGSQSHLPGGSGGGYPGAPGSPYHHATVHDDEAPRGRSRSRDPPPHVAGGKLNPFDERVAEPSDLSLRGVSPRPAEETGGTRGGQHGHHEDDERRSIFREDIR